MNQLSLLDTPPSPEAIKAHFDPKAAAEQRTTGIALTEQSNKLFVETMRKRAKEIALHRGEVHIDHLREYALSIGVEPESPNAWGAIFRCKGWRKVGYRQSEFISNHGRTVPIWSFNE